jgi:hypothetical protein
VPVCSRRANREQPRRVNPSRIVWSENREIAHFDMGDERRIHNCLHARARSILNARPEGKIILTVWGQRMAFMEKDAESIFIYWPDEICKQPRPPHQFTTPPEGPDGSLARWLRDPKEAECFERSLPDTPDEKTTIELRIWNDYYKKQIDPSVMEPYTNSNRAVAFHYTHIWINHPGIRPVKCNYSRLVSGRTRASADRGRIFSLRLGREYESTYG